MFVKSSCSCFQNEGGKPTDNDTLKTDEPLYEHSDPSAARESQKKGSCTTGWTGILIQMTLLLGLLSGRPFPSLSATTRHEASNQDPNPGPVGERPYEMEGRKEERTPLVPFDDVSGWVVEGNNAEGWLYRTNEQRIYGDWCGKVIYKASGENPDLMVRPKDPIPIPEPWDRVNSWTYGNRWDWMRDPTTPAVHLFAVVRDSEGKAFEIDLKTVRAKYWFLRHGLPSPDQIRNGKPPFSFVGIRLRNGTNEEPRVLYFGPLYFYKEEMKPLAFDPWPEELPFPTRPETILPMNKTADFENETRYENGTAFFVYRGEDCNLEYRYTPSDGTLGDITLVRNKHTIRPFAGGGIRLAEGDLLLPVDSQEVERNLEEATLQDGVFLCRWRFRYEDLETHLTYRFQIDQKSLIVEMEADNPVVGEVSLGRVEPVSKPKLIKVPYLSYGSRDPHVLLSDGLFFLSLFDHYYSNASVLEGGNETGDGWAVHNRTARYIPKTDGERNPLRERLFLNVSPDFQEVLPVIPNPPSPMKDVQAERLWRTRVDSNHENQLKEARKFRFYGGEKVTTRFHEGIWRKGGESFTFRLEANPDQGGDEGLKEFVKEIQSLGWKVGLYTNYTDYSPVNKYWNEDWVTRTPDGDWLLAWARCYAPKPMVAVQMEALLAPQIHAKFGPDHSYCDVHTAVPPFSRVDYDHRVPGAATFRRTFECFGRLLLNEKKAYEGPVYSEGGYHWFYAGMTDGNYGQIRDPRPSELPFLVDFDLLMIHPLEMDAGMGAPNGMFFKGDVPKNPDQFLATTLAYGHIGELDWGELERDLKTYYMLQQIQQRYAMVPVGDIQYEDRGEMVGTSQALISETCTRRRVHVFYRNGTHVYVNGEKDIWHVLTPFGPMDLPEWGFVSWRDDDRVLVWSAERKIGGPGEKEGPSRRMDLSLGEDQFYGDSRGGFAILGPIALEGSAALKKEGDHWEVIPTLSCRDFAFPPSLIGASPDVEIQVIGLGENNRTVLPPETRWSRGFFHIRRSGSHALKYRLEVSPGKPRPVVNSDSALAPIGATVEVYITGRPNIRLSSVFWQIGVYRYRTGVKDMKKNRLIIRVPKEAKEGEHIWVGFPTDKEPIWADFIAVHR